MNYAVQRESTQPWILTFYSFKGGTGRTLCLANVARYLAETEGYRVGLVDLDIEAPGLPFQRLSSECDDPKKHEAILKTIQETPGFIDLFLANSSDYLSPIREHVVALPNADGALSRGTILLMPAGRRSLSIGGEGPPLSYSDRLRDFTAAAAETDSEGRYKKTAAILDAFGHDFSLDVIFLDARTGANVFYDTYFYSIPHALVLFFGLNAQNIEGSLALMAGSIPKNKKIPAAPAILVATPVPTVGSMQLEALRAKLRRRLKELKEQVPEGHQRVFDIPEDAQYFLPYNDLAAFEEAYFPGVCPHSALAEQYRQLAMDIARLTKQPFVEVVRANSKELVLKSLEQLSAPLCIAAEDVMYERFIQLFGDGDIGLGLGKPKEELSRDKECTELRWAVGTPGRDIVVDLWPATGENAPWERLANSKVNKGESIPDLLMIPQDFLPDLIGYFEPSGGLYADLGHARYSLEEELASLGIFNYPFLDEWYPGWRRSCTYHGRVLALPFSANATLQCVNSKLLRTYCDQYWQERQTPDQPPASPFIPFSWPLLGDLVRAAARAHRSNGDRPFAFASAGRAIYFEWLNILLAHGEMDLEVGEGGVARSGLRGLPEENEEPRLCEAMRATIQFLRLHHESSRGDPVSMSQLNREFAKGRLGMYMAWTDSFRFDMRTDGSRELRPARMPHADDGSAEMPIRLAVVPKDVRFPRRHLLAGWVFAVKGLQSDQDRTVKEARLRLADYLINTDTQSMLLGCGFPSASLGLVQRELRNEELRMSFLERGDRTSDYQVFLRTIANALTSGHWVPAIRGARELSGHASAMLNGLLELGIETRDRDSQAAYIRKIANGLTSYRDRIRAHLTGPSSGGTATNEKKRRSQ